MKTFNILLIASSFFISTSFAQSLKKKNAASFRGTAVGTKIAANTVLTLSFGDGKKSELYKTTFDDTGEFMIKGVKPCLECQLSLAIDGYEAITIHHFNLYSRETVIYNFKPTKKNIMSPSNN